MPTFVVHTPVGVNQIAVKKAIRAAVAEATKRGKLRPNSVDSLTGKNSGDNLGVETPVIHFEQWENDEIEVKLILKGGGCENKNIQYSLPMRARSPGQSGTQPRRRAQVHPACRVAGARARLRAGRGRSLHRQRSRARVRARERPVVPHAGRHQSRFPSWRSSKPKSWRRPIASASARWDSAAKSSLIGCKIGAANRLPASFFVSVAYECWAFRRLGVRLDASSGAITEWLYRDPARPGRKDGTRRRLPPHRTRSDPAPASHRGAGPRAQGRRRGPDHGRNVHRSRRRARAPHEESSARRYARSGALSLRSRDAETRASSGP